tara:strand:+ start:57 stop:299 length:243 start_codon:yes stop_codon:yes gene_type:complete
MIGIFWKVLIVVVVYLFHHFQGMFHKGIILGFLIWVAIPDGTELLWIAPIAIWLGIPLMVAYIVFMILAWILVFLVWRYL